MKILHHNSESILPAHSSDKSLAVKFALFFCDKIREIGDTLPTSGSVTDAPTLAPPAFNAFEPVSADEVHKIIFDSPTKSCLLDPILTFLLKVCLSILLPSITKLVNYSLSVGCFLDAFKKAVITLL